MSARKVLAAALAATTTASFVFWATSRDVQGQAGPQLAARVIESLAEPGQNLQITDVSTETGFVSFAASRGNGLLLPVDATASPEERALAFVDAYGASFGLRGRSQAAMLRQPTRDELGLDHVRLQQLHQGLPVRGGELVVHLRGARVMGANGLVLDRLPDDVRPAYPSGAAEIEARAVVEKAQPGLTQGMRLSAPRLEIFGQGVFGKGDRAPQIAWFVEAAGPSVREFIWIDAATGGVLLNFSQLPHAKNRSTYNGNSAAALPGTLARSEGQGPTGNAEVDNAHDLAGVTYDYFYSAHGRDSYDGLGGALISTVNHCPTPAACPYGNAFWNGTQMVYGAGYASADDVVAHELTHAVTEKSSDLFYYYQSGALNESFSDIFGETVDQLSTVGGGNDTLAKKWKMGEDLPIGEIRDMMTPTLFGDPGKMSDPQFFCVTNGYTNPNGDGGGVHINSGVPNHAYALMVDGGTYNGQTVTGIGLHRASKIQYRALTTYLTSGSRFLDNYNAVNQSCTDLIGQHGITAATCTEVNEALLAVQMNQTWNCSGATASPALCPSGQPSSLFFDNMEVINANWTVSSTTTTQWGYSTGFAGSGVRALYGVDIGATSIHNVTKAAAVVLPANAYMHFKHAFEFENSSGVNWDGGVLEYSTTAGASWISAQTLIDAGQNYNGPLSSDNPLGAVQAFTKASFGYTGTRLNLSTLAGQSTQFRFRVGTDPIVGSLGWMVDDVNIYTCVAGVGPTITAHPSNQNILPAQNTTFTAAASGTPPPTWLWQVSINGGATWTGLSNNPPYSGVTTSTLTITNATAQLSGYRYRAVATNPSGTATTNSALLTVGTHALTITAGPTGIPNPVGSGGVATVSVTASDSLGHALTYAWSALCPTLATNGSFANPALASTTWTAPLNPGADQSCALQVTVSDGAGISQSPAFNMVVGVALLARTPFDFDGDGLTDVSIYRPSLGQWWTQRSSTSAVTAVTFGISTDIITPGDYTGDGLEDVAVFRPSTGTWYVLRSEGTGFYGFPFGTTGDIPAPADYDGDGITDPAVFRPSTGTWYILKSTGGVTIQNFGVSTDQPAAADFDGDGRADIAIFRPSLGQWWILQSTAGLRAVGFGLNGDRAAPGDYTGDGKADMAVFRPSSGTWYVRRSEETGFYGLPFGVSTDVPVTGDYDGDGRIDIAVFRPSTGTWYIMRSTGGTQILGFGVSTDKAVPSAYIRFY
jgi:bacillolysin